MTGGMAYEAINNLGHSKRRVIIVLNDNGRSYAPTVSNLSANSQGTDDRSNHPSIPSKLTDKLAHALTDIRLNPVYVRRQRRIEEFLANLPAIGPQAEKAMEGFKAGVREFLQPPAFFESLGVRYVGPVNGHDIAEMEAAFRNAELLSDEGPIVVHVLTQKGRGYSPAEDDDEKHLHDAPVFDPITGPPKAVPTGYTQAFAEGVIKIAERDPRIVAITAAMPGPTGPDPVPGALPRPILRRRHRRAARGRRCRRHGDVRSATRRSRSTRRSCPAPGIRCCTTSRCTGCRSVLPRPGRHHRAPTAPATTACTTWRCCRRCRACGCWRRRAPRSCTRCSMTQRRSTDSGPVVIRYPRGAARQVDANEVGSGLHAARLRCGGDVCLLAVGRMLEHALKAAERAGRRDGIEATVWDVRSCAPLDPEMIADAAAHRAVVTVEDGIRAGGIGMAMADEDQRDLPVAGRGARRPDAVRSPR